MQLPTLHFNPLSSAASLIMKHNAAQEARIGVDLCMNGGGKFSCPVVAQVSHFGSTNESAGLQVGVNAKVTGPLIATSGGWFVRFAAGTPSTLKLTSVQVNETQVLLLAIPYPSGTTFNITHQAASWCGPSWATCTHNFRQVGSVAEVYLPPFFFFLNIYYNFIALHTVRIYIFSAQKLIETTFYRCVRRSEMPTSGAARLASSISAQSKPAPLSDPKTATQQSGLPTLPRKSSAEAGKRLSLQATNRAS